MFKKLGLLAAVGAAVAGIAAGTAAAGPDNVYLCYSSSQVDPGVWGETAFGGNNVTSSQLLKMGYWLPYAEKSVPTHTKLGNGYYLLCNLTQKAIAGATQVSVYVDATGHRITDPYLAPTLSPADGYYQEAP